MSTMSEEVFEISDFTTVSHFETFVAHFEELLRDGAKQWTRRPIKFSKIPFSVTKHDGVPLAKDFPPKAHCLERWFGVHDFLVVSPETDDSVATEDRALLLLSGVALAMSASSSAPPVFCQLSRYSRRLFCGVWLSDGFRVDFRTIHLNRAPKSLRNLSGLLALFRRKLDAKTPEIRLSIRVTFCLKNWPKEWFEEKTTEEESRLRLQENAAKTDPLLELQLAALWPEVTEEVVIDSDIHSDLSDPQNAFSWTLRALFDDSTDTPIARSLRAFAALTRRPETETLCERKETLRDSSRVRQLLDEWVFGAEDEDREEESLAMKAAPMGGLSWRVAVVFANLFFETGSEDDLALFWRLFVSRLRVHWEEACLLPHCEVTCSPDLSESLFEQKMQFLQKCLKERKKETEDEFFDATEDAEEDKGQQCRGLYLLHAPDEPLMIPRTQNAPPMTEDMIAEQMAVLQSLGSSAESAKIRARIQSASLASDMSAFKAANNSSAVFEDFIRWHSARDFDENCGQLSQRFRDSNNIWRELWTTTDATPIERQKPLFDFTRDAEKVLHFLSAQTLSSLASLLSPIVAKAAVRRAQALDAEVDARALVDKYAEEGFEGLVDVLAAEERRILRFGSLFAKLCAESEEASEEAEIRKFANELLSEPEVEIASVSRLARIVRRMFAESERLSYESRTSVGERAEGREAPVFPPPAAKEFILRAHACRPNAWSRASAQRMYCLVSETETRICGAFSTDTTYC